MSNVIKGNCLCGSIKLAGHGAPLIDVCHCGQCRRWHGGPALGIKFDGGIEIVAGEENLRWYDSSAWAQRGFCGTCGSTLFYRLRDAPEDLYAQAGSFHLPKGLAIHEHIFVDEQPDYYDFKGEAERLTGAELMARFEAEQAGHSND
ncbi:MAG: GFA family protein [Henriciella sp.]|nr:GFA family protein [Henriciella sp.]